MAKMTNFVCISLQFKMKQEKQKKVAFFIIVLCLTLPIISYIMLG